VSYPALLVLCHSVILLLLVGGGAGAQDERVTIRLDGRALFRVGALDDMPAGERARQAERRLSRLLENPTAIAPARIERTAGGARRVVSVAGVPVVTVTEEDAQDNVTTVDALATQWARAVDAALEPARARRLSPWRRFTTEVQASVETAVARTVESAITVVPRALAAVLIIGFFGLLAAVVRRLMRWIFQLIVSDLTLENLLKQVAYYTVWVLGFIIAVDALGFDPQTVVTGLGLTGLALGFALKDIISNFVSGLLILTLRPFHLGDQIVVGETEGEVRRIELRATQIRTYDGRLVLVPNAEVFTSRLTNNTAAPVRRGSVEFPLGYDSDLRTAIETVCRAAQGTPGVLEDPPASVRVRDLGPDDILLEARFWTDSRRSDFLSTSSAVRASLVEALKAAGIGLPDPDVRHIVRRDRPAGSDGP